MSAATASAAFAASEAIRAGEWDDHLQQLAWEVKKRQELYDRARPPRLTTPPEKHQVWAWMNGPGRPHWEIRGTGLVLDEP